MSEVRWTPQAADDLEAITEFIALAAFRHEESDRVPRWCGASSEFWAKAKAALPVASCFPDKIFIPMPVRASTRECWSIATTGGRE